MPARMKLLRVCFDSQTDQPMVPFRCETLGSILRTILSMYVNSSIMKKADNLAKLLETTMASATPLLPSNVRTLKPELPAELRIKTLTDRRRKEEEETHLFNQQT